MQNNPLHNLETKARRHEHVEVAKNVTKIYWQDEVEISDDYAKYHIDFINILLELQSMSESHLGRIDAAHHMIELLPEDTRLIYSAPYRAGS